MDETQAVVTSEAFIVAIITYVVFVATCLYWIYKQESLPARQMNTEDTPSRPAKRKAHPPHPEASENCVREIREFLRAGVPGMQELAKVYPVVRERYHPEDPQGWADSCNAAFCGYGRDIQRRLEECEWELDRMDPCELWFQY